MAIFNLGSINIDLIYKVPHFPTAGETLTTRSFMRALGGKGANQSIALAAAGASVFHIGAANPDDSWLFDEMRASGVDITHVQESDTPTGHAIVSVNDEGENQILLHPGANRAIDIAAANAVLDQGVVGDWVLLQNETNGALEFVEAAKARGLHIAYSAAPFEEAVALALLPHCDLLIVNDGEAAALVKAIGAPLENLGLSHLVITKGAHGADYMGQYGTYHQPACTVDAIDTTGAGDCFYGYFLAGLAANEDISAILRDASAAAALQVTRSGAAKAIPLRQDVMAFVAANINDQW